MDINKVLNDSNNNINMTYYSKNLLDPGFNVVGELHVGHPLQPTESCFGGGDSYISTMSVQRNTNLAAGTWSVITSDLIIGDTTVKVFSSDLTNNAIYIGGDLIYHGFKMGVKDGLSSDGVLGRSSMQQWTGSSWQDITYMVTKADPPYWTYSKQLFSVSDSAIQVRYRNRSGWTKNTLNGINKYWTRIILTSDLGQSPTINYAKLHPSRKEINKDGFVEYFGDARPFAILPFHFGLFSGTSSEINAGDQDLFLTKSIFMGGQTNSFSGTGNKDITTGAALPLPPDLDTSIPIKAQFVYTGDGLSAGNAVFGISLGGSFSGSQIYKTSGSAGVTNPTALETSIETIVPFTGSDTLLQNQFSVELDLSLARPNPQSDLGGFIWFATTRKLSNVSDTYTGVVNMLGVRFQYTKWSEGGHLSGYTTY
jgi:hypothetical protein